MPRVVIEMDKEMHWRLKMYCLKKRAKCMKLINEIMKLINEMLEGKE